MKGLAWGIVYTLLTCALANAVGQQFSVPWKELLPWLSGLGDFLVGIAAISAVFAVKEWWLERRSKLKAEYLQEAFRALTDFSIYLHETKLGNVLGPEKMQVSVNRAFNDVQLFVTPDVAQRFAAFSGIELNESGIKIRQAEIEELRRIIRDQYRAEIGLDKINDPVRWDYWNFLGPQK